MSMLSHPLGAAGGRRLASTVPWVLLGIFCAIPIVALIAPSIVGRLVWTVIVASLPAAIVLYGYHRWRLVCPLYFFARLPILLRVQRARRAPKWLEANYYYFAFSLFFISLWLRLNATNGDGYALAFFFVAIAALAFLVGFGFTGRTWCNYLCPLSFIEKIYTEPRGIAQSQNSQCVVCTACKSSCPDISEENGYWKEISLASKRFAYFAFPGLVFGFYLYFFLQAGNWDYYFSGRWTNEPALLLASFLPGTSTATAGFSFLMPIPRAVASALTLAACSAAGLCIFLAVEHLASRSRAGEPQPSEPERLRHTLFTVAAFVAFLAFYAFAGQPTLRHLPAAAGIAESLAAVIATLFLLRRLGRSHADFAEESVARGIVRRWQWIDIQPPSNLHDALLIARARGGEGERSYARGLQAYSDAVRETIAAGFVTPGQIGLLEGLREQLQITTSDQERLLTELEEDDRALLGDPLRRISPEKRLQLDSYRVALERYLQSRPESQIESQERDLASLRREYQITAEEHGAILDSILGGSEARQQLIDDLAAKIEHFAQAERSFAEEGGALLDLLAGIARREKQRAEARLQHYTGLDARLKVAPGTAGHGSSSIRLVDELRNLLEGADPCGRALALYALHERGLLDPATAGSLAGDENALVRETVEALGGILSGAGTAAPESAGLTVARMVALHNAPIFAGLPPEELATLARTSTPVLCVPGETLCREGEPGEDAYILLSGRLEVFRRGDSGELPVGHELPGAVVGELAVLDPAPRAATVCAGPEGASLLRLGRETFTNVVRAEPAIAAGILASVARRLRSMGA